MNNKDYNRIWAFLIDTLILSLLGSLVSSIFFTRGQQLPVLGIEINGWMLVYNLCILLYFFIFDATHEGVTIGKSILSIKVYKEDGTVPALPQRLLRSFLKWISFLALLISALAYIFSRRTLHDTVCNTKTM